MREEGQTDQERYEYVASQCPEYDQPTPEEVTRADRLMELIKQKLDALEQGV